MTSACSGPGATPNVRHLMLFDQVVRRGSVSAAARAAHLSQPAVTQAVARIEAALGARLLHRSYCGLELTGAGRAAAQRVERALEMLREALGAVRTRAGDAAYGDVMRGITSTQLKALIAVVEEGAFARAARRAGRARAAVHRAARQLERSEEHTSELQSQSNLVCRLLLEKKKKTEIRQAPYSCRVFSHSRRPSSRYTP